MIIKDVPSYVRTQIDEFKQAQAERFNALSVPAQKIVSAFLSTQLRQLIYHFNQQDEHIVAARRTSLKATAGSSTDDMQASSATLEPVRTDLYPIPTELDPQLVSTGLTPALLTFLEKAQAKLVTERIISDNALETRISKAKLVNQTLDSLGDDPVSSFWKQETANVQLIPEELRSDLKQLLHLYCELMKFSKQLPSLIEPIPQGIEEKYHKNQLFKILLMHIESEACLSELDELRALISAYDQPLDNLSLEILAEFPPSLRNNWINGRTQYRNLNEEIFNIRSRLEANPEHAMQVARMIFAYHGFLEETCLKNSTEFQFVPFDFPSGHARVCLGIVTAEAGIHHSRMAFIEELEHWPPVDRARHSFIEASNRQNTLSHPAIQRFINAYFTPEELAEYTNSLYRKLSVTSDPTEQNAILFSCMTNEGVREKAKFHTAIMIPAMRCAEEPSNAYKAFLQTSIAAELMTQALLAQGRVQEAQNLSQEAMKRIITPPPTDDASFESKTALLNELLGAIKLEGLGGCPPLATMPDAFIIPECFNLKHITNTGISELVDHLINSQIKFSAKASETFKNYAKQHVAISIMVVALNEQGRPDDGQALNSKYDAALRETNGAHDEISFHILADMLKTILDAVVLVGNATASEAPRSASPSRLGFFGDSADAAAPAPGSAQQHSATPPR